jgi:putative glutamine amidotransferase
MGKTFHKPVIGVSGGYHDFGDYLGVGYHRPVALAGGVPIILPQFDDAVNDLLDLCDGLILAGGRDIDPRFYHQDAHEKLKKTDPARDVFELDLIRQALDRSLPILGICRGIQTLNVALGGTLVQDLGLIPAWREHPSDPDWIAWRQVEQASLNEQPVPPHPRHPIAIEPGSRLHHSLGVEEIEVDSFHHQALDQVAPGLNIVAKAPDGVIEAVEMDGAWVLAVQWELQEEWRVDARFLRLFENFVAAAGSHELGPRAEAVHA